MLPAGPFSRTIGLVFSLRCGKFFAVAGCVFLGWFYQSACGFLGVFAKDFSIRSTVFLNFAEVVKFVLT